MNLSKINSSISVLNLAALTVALGLPGVSLAAGGTTTPQQVKVVNTAAEAMPVIGSVAVTNGALNPVMTNVKQRERFQATLHASHTSDMGDYYANADVTFNVPAGKKLIVEHVSAYAISGATYLTVEVTPDEAANSGFMHFFAMAKQGLWGGTYSVWSASDSVPVTATTSLTVRAAGNGGTGILTDIYASVSGYFVPASE